LWLIFKNYSKAEKSLSCYFCQINSTQELGVGPVALDRSFLKLSNGIKFTRFGLANLKWLNFKVEAVLEKFELDLNKID
jgi:hypothetical protein